MEFAHIGISVADLKTSIAWYAKWFHLSVVKEFAKEEFEIKGALLSNDNFSIEILQPHRLVKNTTPAASLPEALRSQGNNHFSIAVSNIAELYASLEEEGVKPLTELIDGRFFFCTDPDGTLIEVKSL